MTTAGLRIARSRSCGAQISWLKNDTTTRPAPIDARPGAASPVTLAVAGGQRRYPVLTTAELEAGVSGDRYTNHFQTCVQADRHKKRG